MEMTDLNKVREILKLVFHDWYNFLDLGYNDIFIDEFIKTIPKIKEEYTRYECYPKVHQIFRAFKEVSPNRCKNVILGLDPYPNKYKGVPSACGLSFVTENGFVNPSLKMLLKTLNLTTPEDFYNKVINDSPTLMLNTSFTIQAGKTNSHSKYWKNFSEVLINIISKKIYNLNWILLGKAAQEYKQHIFSGNIKTAPHPASYVYKGGQEPKELQLLFKELKWI